MHRFQILGFNPCESLLRHTPQQLRSFLRRMKEFGMNSIIIHYDYGWKRYQKIIEEECAAANIEITLMVFGPRTFFSLTDWKKEYFAKNTDGKVFTPEPECETHPCRFSPEGIEAFRDGAEKWLLSIPFSIKRVHMRAGDGYSFCRCPKCRQLPEHERWQPFIEEFVKAAKKLRPELKLETDLYIRRYHIPESPEIFNELDRIMFDTFFRHVFYPIGSKNDVANKFCMQYIAPDGYADCDTPNEYYLKRLEEWSKAFPGKIYIHENVMCQGFLGTFQHNTGVYKQDLNTFEKLELGGICYEAYEPFFNNFAPLFETLANKKEYHPDILEKILPQTSMRVFCDNAAFPLGKYLDSKAAQHAEFFRRHLMSPDAANYRNFVNFVMQDETLTDPLLVGYGCARHLYCNHKAKFQKLSDEAESFINSRKLWDFMEKIPLTEDPRQICKNIIYELTEKIYDIQ